MIKPDGMNSGESAEMFDDTVVPAGRRHLLVATCLSSMWGFSIDSSYSFRLDWSASELGGGRVVVGVLSADGDVDADDNAANSANLLSCRLVELGVGVGVSESET